MRARQPASQPHCARVPVPSGPWPLHVAPWPAVSEDRSRNLRHGRALESFSLRFGLLGLQRPRPPVSCLTPLTQRALGPPSSRSPPCAARPVRAAGLQLRSPRTSLVRSPHQKSKHTYCVRPQVDPGPLLSARLRRVYHILVSHCAVSIPSPAPGRRRISRAPTTSGAITKQLVRDHSRTNHNSYVQMGCMQPVVPDSLGISVSLAGRN